MKTFTPSRFDYLGLPVTNPSPHLLLCPKRGIGVILYPHLLRPREEKHVRWLTLTNVVNLSGTSESEVKRRIRDGWTGYELTKPDGYQRAVDARKNGITWKGAHASVKDWANRLGLTLQGFQHRLADVGLPMELVMSENARPQRTNTTRCPQGVTDNPRISASGTVAGVFFYNGAVDTLAGHAKAAGLSLSTVQYRLRRTDPDGQKMTIAKALGTAKGCVVRTDRGVRNPKKGYRDPFATPALPKLAEPAAPIAEYAAGEFPKRIPRPDPTPEERAQVEAEMKAFDL